MSKGKPEDGDRKAISIRGKRRRTDWGWTSKQFESAGHEVRGQDRREEE